MKVLFLDFDGVLNSTQSTIYHLRNKKAESFMFRGDWCPIAISNMQRVLEKIPDLKVVVSSSWRKGRSTETLQDILTEAGLTKVKVISATQDTSPNGKTRGHEIKDWLDAHPEVTQYAIVDDDADMLPEQQDRFVHVEGHIGLTILDACHIYRLLGDIPSVNFLMVNYYDDYE